MGASRNAMKIVCISDTHQRFPVVPDGDVLVHAGDWTWEGEARAVRQFYDWILSLPHKHKVIITGNHDIGIEDNTAPKPPKEIHYLENSGVVIDGVKFYGSPITPTFGNWAFMRDRGDEITKYWNMIPNDTDVLITHGPPQGILDKTPARWGSINAGCYDLLQAVKRVKPKLMVFGHIHHGYGVLEQDGTTFVNASICDEEYDAVNQPVCFELTRPKNHKEGKK